MIKHAWEEQKEIRAVMLFLQSHGVSSGYAAKIFKQYGNDASKIVQENPYRLATDIFGIGFITADKIAEKLGFAKNSDLRAGAGILFVLHEMTDEGHVYYPYEPLIVKCKEVLDIDREVIVKALGTLEVDKEIVIEDMNQDLEAFQENNKAVYLIGYHIAETSLAARLKRLLTTPQAIREIDSEKAIQWVQDKLSITLADKQIEAVRSAAGNKVMIITGGPGTGKTTIITAILKIFSALKTKIMLAAPTGRAAKRIREATGHETQTIHPLLEYDMRKRAFDKNY